MAKNVRKLVRRIFNHIDPLFMYIPLVYYLSKVYQWLDGDTISVWQALWNRIQLIFGDYEILLYIGLGLELSFENANQIERE